MDISLRPLFGFPLKLYVPYHFRETMTEKIVHQCWVCGKRHDTLEAAQNCHEGPTQSLKVGYTRHFKRKGLLGN